MDRAVTKNFGHNLVEKGFALGFGEDNLLFGQHVIEQILDGGADFGRLAHIRGRIHLHNQPLLEAGFEVEIGIAGIGDGGSRTFNTQILQLRGLLRGLLFFVCFLLAFNTLQK